MSALQKAGNHPWRETALIDIPVAVLGVGLLLFVFSAVSLGIAAGLQQLEDESDNVLTIEECMEQYDVSRATCVQVFEVVR